MNEDYTFQQAVHAIDRATITGRPFPRALRDNGAGDPLLSLDWARQADRDAWLEFFGATLAYHDGDYSRWARGWHGWTVLMTAPDRDEDSEAGAVTSAPSPASVDVLAEGEAAAADLMCDPCIEVSARRVTGQHRAEDLDRLPTVLAALDPDATIQMPCVQSTAREVHGGHTRHEGAYSRFCLGYCWDAPTMQMASVPR